MTSLVDATCDMHRHAGAADALIALLDGDVTRSRWTFAQRDELMQRALSHQRLYAVARAAYLAAGGEMSNAERLNAGPHFTEVPPQPHSDAIDGAIDAMETAINFGTAEEMDAAKARLDAAVRAARVSA